MRPRHDAGGDVLGRIMAGRNLLALAQLARPLRHVVVIDFRWRRHRRIGEAQVGGVELVAAHGVERVGGLAERNRMLLVAGEIADDDRGQRIGALQTGHVSGIKLEIEDVDARAMRDQIAPVGTFGRSKRRRHDLEVDRAVGIAEDVQLIAAVGERVLHTLFTRRDQARRRVGVFEIDQPLLGRLMVAAGDHAEAAARAFVQMGEPAGILLLINQDVIGLLRAQAMPPDLHRPVVVVELDVEEASGVRTPHHAAVGFLDDIVEVGPRGPVADANGEIFRALGVRTPGMEPVVRGMPAAAELEIFVVGRQRIAVENDLHLAAVARGAAEHFVLAAFAEFAQIGERAVRRRHAGIVFLDSPAHFRDQLLLQRGRVAEQAFGVIVLGFEIAADVRIQDRRVAQHFLPFRVLQPRIIIGDGDAVPGERMRPPRRHGGFLGLLGCCLCHSNLIRCKSVRGAGSPLLSHGTREGHAPYIGAGAGIARCAAPVTFSRGCWPDLAVIRL